MRQEVLQFLQKEIDEKHIPGAVIQVQQNNELILQEAIGYRSIYEQKAAMTIDTMFDLASLTKVVATTTATLYLLDQGKIRLEDKVCQFIPDFIEEGKDMITLRHLLSHTSGLPAALQLPQGEITKEIIADTVCHTKLGNKVGEKVVYSDIGFVALYLVIEAITQEPFEQFIKNHILQPLKMSHTSFNPNQASYKFAKTEYADHLATYKNGLVHDENTERMGGISGHAGLFSTISDLGHYAQMILNEGLFEDRQFLSPHSIRLSRRNFTAFDPLHRGIGWELNGRYAASCGDYFPQNAFGHTGFTGTSMWFDPDINLAVTLLTNRVHYGRHPHMLSLRPRLHNMIRKHF
ncbi:MAG TPA: serine hydrolase [Pseudogracilibacillus sp.]|nr:serine hydrolase [Pseudogracilibacillus sp.]